MKKASFAKYLSQLEKQSDDEVIALVDVNPQVDKKFINQLKSLFKDDPADIDAGFDLILQQLASKPNGQHCLKELDKAGIQLLESAVDTFEVLSELKEIPKEHHETVPLISSLAHECGISVDTLKTIYEIGEDYFTHQEYEKAIPVFKTLAYLNATCFEAWLSLGICCQQVAKFPDAIFAYSMASLLSPKNITPYLYSCECFLALNDNTQAKGCLEMAEYFEKYYPEGKPSPLLKELHKKVA